MKYDLVRFSNGQYGVRRTRLWSRKVDFSWLGFSHFAVPGEQYFQHCQGSKEQAQACLDQRQRRITYVVVPPEGERLLNGKTKE